MNRERLTVEYDPILDVYYIPSRSRGSRINKWEVFQSRRTDEWICNCESFCIGLQYRGECRHIKIAKFYKNNEWNKKYYVMRNHD
jgi:hypothetical protein